jgi:hypothetical protein
MAYFVGVSDMGSGQQPGPLLSGLVGNHVNPSCPDADPEGVSLRASNLHQGAKRSAVKDDDVGRLRADRTIDGGALCLVHEPPSTAEPPRPLRRPTRGCRLLGDLAD